jgi:hypothetical protein
MRGAASTATAAAAASQRYVSTDSAEVKLAARVILAAEFFASMRGRATNVGASAASLAAFAASLRRALPAQLGPVSVTWCLVGDRASPQDTIAAVFAVRRLPSLETLQSASGAAAAAAASSAPLRTEYAFIPLVPDAVWRRMADVQSPAPPVPAPGAPPHDFGPIAPCVQRWRTLAHALATPDVPKLVLDAKTQLYPLLLCPATAHAAVVALWDPLIAAWMLSPDTVSKGTSLHPLPWDTMVACGLVNARGAAAAPPHALAALAEGAAAHAAQAEAAIAAGRKPFSARAAAAASMPERTPARSAYAPYDRQRLMSLAQLAAGYAVTLPDATPDSKVRVYACH